MQGISIAENSESFVLLFDKMVYPKERIANALKWLRQTEELDTSHLEPITDEEQAELETLLNSRTAEEREIGFVHEVIM
jgi:hypothetical protein